MSHCPRRAPSTRQSRDPETHRQAKSQLLSLSQGQMLSSEVLQGLGAQKCSCPDRSPPPCYQAQCGAGLTLEPLLGVGARL